MTFWNNLLLVALGGAIGSTGRYLVGSAALRLLGPQWPWGTFAVNILGGFAMGVLVAALVKLGIEGSSWRLFLATGVLGGFTTFSAFSLETALMIERNALLAAAGYALASVVLCVGAVFAGMGVSRAVLA